MRLSLPLIPWLRDENAVSFTGSGAPSTGQIYLCFPRMVRWGQSDILASAIKKKNIPSAKDINMLEI